MSSADLASSNGAIRVSVDASIPATLTPLVGRTRDVQEIAHILTEQSARLLVLTGPGGVGKTRLAIAVAQQLGQQWSDGALVISVAPVTTTEQVMTTVAAALGIRESRSDHIESAVIEYLRDRELLLVLDNFEQVLVAAPLLTDLLTHAPKLTALVTSRSVLGVYGEYVYPVPPMSVPDIENATMEAIEQSEAVQLFVSRVRSMRPEFGLNTRNARDIATICLRLDGLPLAIELAAARTSLFAVSTLAERLEKRLPVLESGLRNVPDRLRTMRNAIAWSYDLLTPYEQDVFRKLCIFVGGWNLDAAEILVLAERRDNPVAQAELIDAIESLVNKSLIQRIEVDHEWSFRILQTLREFGLNELERKGDRALAETRHTEFILAFAERASPNLIGHQAVAWLNQMEMLYSDFQVVFERLMASSDDDMPLKLATWLWRFGYTRGHIYETQQWLERALARSPERTSLRAQALNAAGILSNMAGDHVNTRRFHGEALEIGRELGDENAKAMALFGLGDIATFDDDPGEAERIYLEAEQIYARLDDARGIATAQTNLGNLYWSLGRLEEAININEAARRLYESAGDQRGMAWSVTNVGRLAGILHEHSRAALNLSQALELYDLLGDRSGIAETLEGFAYIAHSIHNDPLAARMLGSADHLRKELGYPVPQTDLPGYSQLVQDTAAAMGDLAFQKAWSDGEALPLEDAMQMAIDIRIPETPAEAASILRAPSQEAAEQIGITDRELEVLERLGGGETDKEIADHLYISVRTVQSHVQNLLNKFEVSSRSAAVAKAFRVGLLR